MTVAMSLLVASATPRAASAAEPTVETPAERDARMAWWREARFGMFIHWGLYSAAGGEWEGKRCRTIASWLAHEAEIPPDQYEAKLLPLFNASKFDPASWAKLAKRAGMKYMVVTSKHHEGFCLFDSKLTDYDAVRSAAGRDLLRPLLDAFRAEGLRVGTYHSVIDWHHPDYPVAGDSLHPMRNSEEYKAQPRDLNRYLDYLHGQAKELVTNYGPLDIMWWDFSYGRMSGETWRSAELIKLVRDAQPGIVMNNRLVAIDNMGDNVNVDQDARFAGDFRTPEQLVPANGIPGVDWETCMTMNDTWGYKPHDKNFKSSRQLIRTLIDIASKGGNYLLNIGPRPDGTIPEESIECLVAIGNWMDVNGAAIHRTTATPFARQRAWGRVTTGPTANGVTPLYLHVFDWPKDGKLCLDPLENKIQGAYFLADQARAPLAVEKSREGLVVTLPGEARDADATVIVLEVEDAPAPLPFAYHPQADGRFVLTAAGADLHGSTIRYPSDSGAEESIGYWTNAGEWVSWPLSVPKAGAYRVQITYGCDASGGGTYKVEAGGQTLRAESKQTGGWFKRVTDSIGTLDLPAGATTLAVRIEKLAGVAALDLAGVELVPVE